MIKTYSLCKNATGIFLVAFLFTTHDLEAQNQGAFYRFRKLTLPEKLWVLRHPFIAKSAYSLSNEARQITQSIKADTTLDGDENGGQLDAFRHCFWMATVCQKHGWRAAYTLGRSHEKGNYRYFKKNRKEDNALPDSVMGYMDFLNNDAGIQLGKDYSNASQEEIVSLVIQQLHEGKLFIVKKDLLGNYLDCDGNPIPIKNYFGIWSIPKCIVPSNHKK